MGYQGRSAFDKTTQTLKLDSLAASFNGAQTVFALTSGGAAVYAASTRNLLISINGVVQEPDVAYTVSGSSITFTSAPATGATFFGILNGQPNDIFPTSAVTLQTVTISNTATITGKISANGSTGSSGDVLTSNSTGVYWAPATAGAQANSTGGTGAIQYYNGSTLGSSANLVFSGTNIFVGNSTVNANYGQATTSVANSTNTATLTPVSLTIGTQVANTTGFYAGANVYANATTIFVGNSSVNVVTNSSQISIGSGTLTATSYSGTANNATYAYGKTEGNLNVNNATTAGTANNATYAYGKTEGTLNVNNATTAGTANNATYAYGKTEGTLNVNNALTSNQSTYLAGAAVTGNSTALTVGANVYLSTSTLFVGNSTVNVVTNSSQINIGTGTLTAAAYSGTANNSTYAYGKTEGNLNVNNASTANQSTYLAGAAVTGNSTALTVGANVYLSTSTLFVGNSTVNVVANSSQINIGAGTLTSTAYSGTANNATYAFGKTEGNLNVNSALSANNASNFNGQAASYYTNASNINTGTLPLAQLNANVILTTSATGINASALSTGSVPAARLTSANSSVNGVVDTTTQTFAGNKNFANDVTITGNLNVLGASITVGANNLIVDDSLIQLAANNTTSDLLDIGLYGNYNGDGGAHEHTGLFRDASDGVWRLFIGLQESPSTTVNTAGTGYAVGTLVSYLTSGILTTNSTQLQITANSTYNANLVVNSVAAQTFTGNLTGTSSNATNLNNQPGTYYTNASNINTGTLPLAQLDANVILTTSVTGMNASALSTGTVPDARLSGTYTNITANNATYAYGKTEGNLNVNSAVYANNATYAYGKTEGNLNVNSAVYANNSTYAYGKTEGSLSVGSALTANQSTYLAGAAVTGNSTALTVGANVYLSTSTLFVGNSTVNVVANSSQINIGAGTLTATTYSGTANNATNAFGKTEGNLNVNNALTANQSTYLAGAAVTGNSTALTVGANVYLSTSTLFVGNSTINSSHTATTLTVANSTNTATLTPVSLTIGASVINTLALTINSISMTGTLSANGSTGASGQVLTSNSTGGVYWSTSSGGSANTTGGTGGIQYYNGTTFGSSANLVFSGTNIFVGNSSANGNYGQLTLALANSTNTATLTPVSLTIGGSVVNTTTIYDQYDSIRAVPINSQTTAYTLVAADNGRTISTNANITVNGAVLSANQVFTVYNNSTATITIAPGTGATIYLAGSADTSTRTLAQRGLATIYCVAANTFVVAGAGLV